MDLSSQLIRRSSVLVFVVTSMVLTSCDSRSQRSSSSAASSGQGQVSFSQHQDVFVPEAPAVAAKAPCFALVIGVKEYQHVQKLINPVRDAQLIRDALQKVYIDVDYVENPTKAELDRAVAAFRKKLQASPGALGFVYFAGHGTSQRGVNWLLPVDFEDRKGALEGKALSLNQLLSCITPRHEGIIVCLDCCRTAYPGAESLITGGLEAVGRTKIIYAVKPGQAASDGTGENSDFAGRLAALIPVPGMNIEEISQQLANVPASSQPAWSEGGGVFYCFAPALRSQPTGGTSPAADFLPARQVWSDAELLSESGYANYQVRYVQRALIGLIQQKLGVLPVTKTNNDKTQRAILIFQQTTGLPMTGRLDQVTLRSLGFSGMTTAQLQAQSTVKSPKEDPKQNITVVSRDAASADVSSMPPKARVVPQEEGSPPGEVSQPLATMPRYMQRAIVGMIQKKLEVPLTGAEDAVTQVALRAYQLKQGLPQNGVLDRETLASLGVDDVSASECQSFLREHQFTH